MTPAQARQLADAYLAENRPWSVVAELLEDSQDYFVAEELKPGFEFPGRARRMSDRVVARPCERPASPAGQRAGGSGPLEP